MACRDCHQPCSDLGRAIRSIRRRLNLSQPELSAKFGWDGSIPARYELGNSIPTAARLIQLLRLAEGAERGAIIRVLQEKGIYESDLSLQTEIPVGEQPQGGIVEPQVSGTLEESI